MDVEEFGVLGGLRVVVIELDMLYLSLRVTPTASPGCYGCCGTSSSAPSPSEPALFGSLGCRRRLDRVRMLGLEFGRGIHALLVWCFAL